MEEAKNPKEIYEKDWKTAIENEDGSINREKMEAILADYSSLMDKVTRVYDEVSVFSNPHTHSQWVIDSIEDKYILKSIAFADLISELEDGKVNMDFDELAEYFDIDEFERRLAKEHLGDRLWK